ncbi:Endonuclease [Ceratocystis platani]|uniref:Endonuclease n=1 Tax=Ceratocystis fimbriata f. sp. platani TaxID=88771 RepID=A0A0F8CMT0_CERFI|nr:Endonuclease [Ceratocystis platani]
MKELNCGSDHFPLSTTIEGIQIDDVVRATRHNMNRLDTEKFTRACARESTSLNAREALRAEDAEELAAGLIKAMTKALDEAAPKALGRGTGKRWWNPQCTGAVREMRSAWRQTEADNFPDASYDAYKEKRRAFQAEIRTAKRELWRQTIENMTDATDVFRMVNRLGKTNPAGGLPPLTQGGTTRRTPQEKAEALLDTHTQPAEDLSRTEEEANPRARLWGKLTPTEVRDAVFHAGNTAPGEDGIPNTAWKLAWPIFGQMVNRLGKTNPAGGLPPLTQGGTTRRTPQEKAEALLDTHTQPAEDLSRTEEEANPRARLWGKLTPTEVRDAVFHAGNTAPGEDGIPNTAWKLAWPIFGQCVVKLFNCCLETGCHPRVFKAATMVAIPKPYRDRRLPRSYRLISLLSTLGKSLERVIARKLSTQAIELRIIPPHYASAVPRRAATDLTWKLADVIVGESKLKKITSLVTFDIKGAFDAVGGVFPRDAVFHAGNTAPGEDGIPNTAWKLAWPIFGQQETPKELPADLATVNPREKPRESDSAKAVDTGDRTTDHPATLRVSGTQEGGHRPDLETGGCHRRGIKAQEDHIAGHL